MGFGLARVEQLQNWAEPGQNPTGTEWSQEEGALSVDRRKPGKPELTKYIY